MWTPTECPYCGSRNIDCEEVHIGVGMQQVSPAECYDCGARQLGPHDWVLASQEEQDTGWARGFDDKPGEEE